jgi:hypothetical protein
MQSNKVPDYDHERLGYDPAYRYAMIDVFKAHMDSIELFANRVTYFMDISWALFNRSSLFNMETQAVPEQRASPTPNGKKYVDEKGTPVRVKYWSLTTKSHDEKRISRKMWILDPRNERFKEFKEIKNMSFADRKRYFHIQLNEMTGEDLFFSRLDGVIWEIDYFHKTYNQWKDKNATDESEDIKWNRLNAPSIIEREMFGCSSASWLASTDPYDYRIFAFLWPMIEFKWWLMQKKNNLTSPPPQPATPMSNPLLALVEYEKPARESHIIPATFGGLFINPVDILPCVNALRQIEQPVISVAGTWIGKKGSKSVLVAWIDRLELCHKIIPTDRKRLVPLLNAYFPNLNFGLDGRMFGEQNDIYTYYKSEFSALILP